MFREKYRHGILIVLTVLQEMLRTGSVRQAGITAVQYRSQAIFAPAVAAGFQVCWGTAAARRWCADLLYGALHHMHDRCLANLLVSCLHCVDCVYIRPA